MSDNQREDFPSSNQMSKPVRVEIIDALRGVAILLVLFCHFAVYPENSGALAPLACRIRDIGWSGVDLFFVLSGFLIGGLLFAEIKKTGTLDVPRFLTRRALKLWPAYLALVAVMFVDELWRNHRRFSDVVSLIAPNLFHLQNYLGTARIHTWSLAVEEHFYLVVPFLILALARTKRLNSIVWITAVVGSICLLCRCLTLPAIPFGDFTHKTPTHLRMDGLMFGVLLGYIQTFVPSIVDAAKRFSNLIVFCGLLALAPVMYLRSQDIFVYTIGYTVMYLGYGLILFGLVNRPERGDQRFGWELYFSKFQKRLSASLAFLGTYSYGIYLWHWDFAKMPVYHYFENGGLSFLPKETSWIIGNSIYLVAAVLAGIVLTRIIEAPTLRWRDRTFPSRANIALSNKSAKVQRSLPSAFESSELKEAATVR